jgi:putative FmdB family regulatory protein
MPTYNYRCPNGHTLEDFQPMSAPTTRLCPECPQPPVEWHENEDEPYCTYDPVLMTRVIGTGGGVIWKEGKPTPTFKRTVRKRG